MRVLFVHQLPSKTESHHRHIKATVTLVEQTLKHYFQNSFEMVIRDQQTINDHIYDANQAAYESINNKKVR
ncbi:MAG: hypothetical protein ACKO96_08240 [Flammeovirgaceae bacterium]